MMGMPVFDRTCPVTVCTSGQLAAGWPMASYLVSRLEVDIHPDSWEDCSFKRLPTVSDLEVLHFYIRREVTKPNLTERWKRTTRRKLCIFDSHLLHSFRSLTTILPVPISPSKTIEYAPVSSPIVEVASPLQNISPRQPQRHIDHAGCSQDMRHGPRQAHIEQVGWVVPARNESAIPGSHTPLKPMPPSSI
jgi:hypothetical protein